MLYRKKRDEHELKKKNKNSPPFFCLPSITDLHLNDLIELFLRLKMYLYVLNQELKWHLPCRPCCCCRSVAADATLAILDILLVIHGILFLFYLMLLLLFELYFLCRRLS